MSDTYNNDSSGGQFRLHVNGSDLELYKNNSLVNSTPLASITSFTINIAIEIPIDRQQK